MNISETRLRNIIRESIDKYLERNVIMESMGVSDEVDQMAKYICDRVIKDMSQITPENDNGWTICQNPQSIKKTFRANKYISKLLDKFTVTAYCVGKSGDEYDLNNVVEPRFYESMKGKRILEFPLFVFYENGHYHMSDGEKHWGWEVLSHELNHALQSNRGGLKLNNIYKNLNFVFDPNNKAYGLISNAIQRAYYYFTPFEVDANIQGLYRELYYNNGVLEKCETYLYYKGALEDYNKVLEYRKEVGYNEAQNMLLRCMNNRMGNYSFNKFIQHCRKGIKRWESGIRRVMRRYQIENNNEQPNQ